MYDEKGEVTLAITFQAHKEFSTFHDPMQEGKLIDRETEIRFDPLTGETSRLIYDPGAPFQPLDYSELAEGTSGKKCPFCSENVLTATPSFPNELVASGRAAHGEAVLFPNLFPYAKHNAVTRMTDNHYVRLEQFTAQLLTDSFSVAHQYLINVLHSDSDAKHASINWNYLPPSGGSILHPHLHVIASERPTRYHQTAYDCGKRYFEENGTSYYNDLLATERRLQERWIGQTGSIGWMHTYAPKSHYDFTGVIEQSPTLSELNEGHWSDLAEGLLNLFQYFKQIGVASFNMALFIPLQPTPEFGPHVRVIPRLTLGALGTSDMSVFNFLHGEYLSLKVPEQSAKAAAEFFGQA